jgi:hypothetical protein
MSQDYASAYPRKSFFIQMFTKDISLEDCILDLIDNSIDGCIRNTGLKLDTISKSIFSKTGKSIINPAQLPAITVTYSAQKVQIKDNCGGIDLEYARTEAFNFGHSPEWESGYLGVYGVGLKRALFKIGDEFEIQSKTIKNGFASHLTVSHWLQQDQSFEDWRIPLEPQPKADNQKDAGTNILISKLHDEVKMRLEAGSIDTSLYRSISDTYRFFINKYVRIRLNDADVEPSRIPLGKPADGTVSYDEYEQDDVRVKIFATVAEKDETGHYDQDFAGWYIVCNGRVVLTADKSQISGWGMDSMPTFQPKHRSFIGVVFFESENPLHLPWTTTKRDLNRESAVYLRARNKMLTAARPVIKFINSQYPSDQDMEPVEREIAQAVTGTSFGNLVAKTGTTFNAAAPKRKVKTTQSVQYHAEIRDLEKVRSHLRRPRMGVGEIGKYTFKYFLEKEGLA